MEKCIPRGGEIVYNVRRLKTEKGQDAMRLTKTPRNRRREKSSLQGRQKLTAALIAFALAFGASAATVEKVVTRQLWPWQNAIFVEFRLSGVTAPTDVQITLSTNGAPVNLPDNALDGELFALGADGLYQAKVTLPPGLIGSEVENLGVLLMPVAPQTSTNILYRIYDLDTGACEEVSAGSIASSQRGDWHWANAGAPHLVPGEATPAAFTNIVWTGFNADDKYKTSHLVMRYVPGKNAEVHILNYPSSHGVVPNNYWIAVYETTQSQWKRIHGSTPPFYTVGDTRPASNISYDSIRGAKGGEGEEDKYYWPNDPDPDSFLGKLRTKTGGVKFDLPWQALWEYACQVNSGWAICNDYTKKITYNTNVAAGTPNGKFVQDDADATAWTEDPNYPGTFKGNSTTYAVVGSYAPNMIGLYDMHGNVREFCVDWANGYVRQSDQSSLAGAANVDLSDYTMMRAWNTSSYPDGGAGTARFCAGSQFDTSLKGQTPNYTRQNATVPNATGHGAGFRVIILED